MSKYKNNMLIDLVQSRSVLTETNDREQRSLRNIDYINMCMFRKTRLCDCKILLIIYFDKEIFF